MTLDLLPLAYHEAGHAVVARHFGCDLVSVRICLDNRSGGATIEDCGLKGRQDGLVALAGYATEALSGYVISDDQDRMGYFNDIAIAQQAVSDMTGLGIRDDGFDNAFDALRAETEELALLCHSFYRGMAQTNEGQHLGFTRNQRASLVTFWQNFPKSAGRGS